MPKPLLLLCLFLASSLAHAWNGAGHRLSALVAWQEMTDPTRRAVSEVLARHPDHPRWLEKSGGNGPAAIFAEAATWPDSIRNDPRFHDADRQAPTPPLPGLADTARHKDWHYVDFDANGQRRKGQLDRQIDRLIALLRGQPTVEQMNSALPWLIHLLGDIHQPLHVGHADDAGGTQQAIEHLADHRQPFGNLHSYWDELPGPSGLRGKRLDKKAQHLHRHYPAPAQGDTAVWIAESRRWLATAYPPDAGSLLPGISPNFDAQSRQTAERRVAEAGYRLGHLLNTLFGQAVPRETPGPRP